MQFLWMILSKQGAFKKLNVEARLLFVPQLKFLATRLFRKRFQDYGCVVLREIDFLLKILLIDSTSAE